MNTVLLTGATGFLGSYLAKAMLKIGIKVIAYKRNSSNLWRLKQDFRNIIWFDVVKELELPFKNHRIDAVIHTATSYGRQDESISEIFAVNIQLPINLIEMARKHRVPLFINSDTFCSKQHQLISGLESYMLTKQQLAQWLKLLANNHTKIVNMRLEHVYGSLDNSTKFIPTLISQLTDSHIKSIKFTPGEQLRDFIYIEDVIDAYLTVLNNQQPLNVNFATFEVGTGETLSIKNLVKLIAKQLASDTKLEFGAYPYRENEIFESKANASFKLNLLGWKAKTNIDSGIKKLITSYKKGAQ